MEDIKGIGTNPSPTSEKPRLRGQRILNDGLDDSCPVNIKDCIRESIIKSCVELLRGIINRHYKKEVIFYNEGEWYSREHCRNISLEELEEWVNELTTIPQHEVYDDTLPCGCCSCCGCSCNDEE